MKFTFLLFVLSIILTTSSFAASGKISGRVTDSKTSEPLVGVNIIIEGSQIGAATDIDGLYFIINLTPGTYTLVSTYIGYERTIIENINVKSDLTSKIDFQMTATSLTTQEVTVVAIAPPIQKDLTSSRQSFSAAEIDAAPAESLIELIAIQAGVNLIDITERASVIEDAPGDGLHIRGGRENETAFLIDGVRVDNPIWGGSSYSQNSTGSAVKEMSTTLGTFNAEYGGKMSGIINLITKEGGDRISGEFSFNTDKFGLSTLDRNTFQGDLTLNGPVNLIENVSFLLNLQGRSTDGRLLGNEIPNWSDLKGQVPLDSKNIKDVPADWQDEFHGLFKLNWNITSSLRIIESTLKVILLLTPRFNVGITS